MMRTLWLALGLALAIGLVSIAFGTSVPPTSTHSPYFSALSNMAVSTAEACGCNQKICSAGICDANPNPEDPTACCIIGGHCRSSLCFP